MKLRRVYSKPIQVERQSGGIARLTAINGYVIVEHGTCTRGGAFIRKHFEALSLRDNPELNALHNGYDWNLEEVLSLVEEAETPYEIIPELVRPTRVSTRWIRSLALPAAY